MKYLIRAGWQPVVLTARNPSVPAIDESLSSDVISKVPVFRTRTLEPGYRAKQAITSSAMRGFSPIAFARRPVTGLLQPDPQILWLPGTIRKGVRLIAEHDLNCVVVSGPPFSSFLLAALISRKAKVPLTVDYRDEWSLSSEYWENRTRGAVSRLVQRRLEDYVLRFAAVVVATTKMSADAIAKACKPARSAARIEHIYNGYDPDDFVNTHDIREIPKRPFVLSYIGTLWNLTSIEPLVLAIEQLLQLEPSIRRELEIVIVGRVTAEQGSWLDRLALTGVLVTRHGYLPHDRAVSLMRHSSALCALLSGVPGAERVVPAKIFEYMAAERPILGILPEGEARRILSDYPYAHCLGTTDISGIVRWLQTALKGSAPVSEDVSAALRPYRRDNQALALADLLASAIALTVPVGRDLQGSRGSNQGPLY